MNIRIFTDLRYTDCATPTGVGKHIVQMVRGMAEDSSNRVSVLATRDQVDGQGQIAATNGLRGLSTTVLPLSWHTLEVLGTLTGRPIADQWCADADWVYCPRNNFIPLRKTRLAVTIHGAHELDPLFPQSKSLSARLIRMRLRLSYQRMLAGADRVLTVSEFLKRQMMEWFRVPEEKVYVVGNGVESEFFAAALLPIGTSNYAGGQPFVLCVGGLSLLDGGDRIVQLAPLLRRVAPDLKILVAGCNHRPELLSAAEQCPNLELLGYVSARDLALLMRDAVALYHPTRYETFGIAVAEAMAAGTPVVTCRSTAVPEVVGETGIYVDPDCPEEAAEALIALLNDANLRLCHSAMGMNRAKTLTWQACVDRLADALKL